MSRQTCNYEGCYNQRLPCSASTFFQLPPDEPRRTQWILNSGNKKLKNLKNTQTRYFCEKHFRPEDIKTHGFRKLLHRHAIIIPHQCEQMKDDTNVSNKSNSIKWTIETNNKDFTVFKEAARDDATEAAENLNKCDAAEPVLNGYKADVVDKTPTSINYQQQQQKEISENRREMNAVIELNLTCDDNYFEYDIDAGDEQDVLSLFMKNQEMDDGIGELGVELLANTPERPNATNELIDIDLDCEDIHAQLLLNTVGAISSDSYTSAASIAKNDEHLLPSLTADGPTFQMYDQNSLSEEDYPADSAPPQLQEQLQEQPTTSSTASSSSKNANRAEAIALLLNAEKEDSSLVNFSNSIRANNSYESDKHYALSLVYLFQRLNAKKKTKAKIDILTYLLALENDDSDELVLASSS